MGVQPGCGQRIRAQRKRLGKSVPDIAAELGVNISAVWQWEQGRTTPRLPNLNALAVSLDTTVGWLIGEGRAA